MIVTFVITIVMIYNEYNEYIILYYGIRMPI